MKILNYRTKKGSSLLLVFFISAIALFITTAMLNSSQKNTNQITDEKSGKLAFYAAEAGLAKATNLYNSNLSNWGIELSNLSLPNESNPETLYNNAVYWIESIEYVDSDTAIIEAIGRYGNAYRKIRANISLRIPDIYNNYGLLTDSVLTIHGDKTLQMDIHANDGLSLTGTTDTENDSTATQSSDPDAGAPNPDSNPVGGYEPTVEIPGVPIDDLRTQAQSGTVLCSIDPDLNTKIASAPAESSIYITNNSTTCSAFAYANNKTLIYAGYNNSKKSKAVFIPNSQPNSSIRFIGSATIPFNDISLNGDMAGKIIFIDGDIIINAGVMSDVSNVMVVSAGTLRINGSADIGTSHTGKVDAIFACQDDITLNGSRSYNALFWTNGEFTQNGSSLSGRVISKEGININGAFTLSNSDKLYDNGQIEKVAIVSSRQQVAME